jgi:hypothetical protein
MGNAREVGWIDQSSEFIMMALYPYFNGLFKSLFNDCPSIINSKKKRWTEGGKVGSRTMGPKTGRN